MITTKLFNKVKMKDPDFREDISSHFRVINRVNFKVYAERILGRLYTPGLPDSHQASGYILLKELLQKKEQIITMDKLLFLHIITRKYVFENWCILKHFRKF
jgi:hypothetical protein